MNRHSVEFIVVVSVFAALLAFLLVGVANSHYQDLDCETRFALERWHYEEYPDELMSGRTFSDADILKAKTLDLTTEEFCRGEE